MEGGLSSTSEFELRDPRVLGSSAFIKQLRQEDALREKLSLGMQILELMKRVERYYIIAGGKLGLQSRDKTIATARDVFCFIAVRILLYKGTEAGKVLSIRRSAVSQAVRRGNEIVSKDPRVLEGILR